MSKINLFKELTSLPKFKYLKIEEKNIPQLFKNKLFWEIPLNIYQNLHYQQKGELALRYFLVLDALNFCFWHKDRNKKFSYRAQKGYLALALLLKELAQKEPTFFAPNNLPNLDFVSFKKYLNISSSNQLLLLKERFLILKKIGRFLKAHKEVYKFLKEKNFDALKIIDSLKKIYGFDDFAYLENRKIYFLKKAQIFVNDISLFLSVKIKNIDRLTCFPDYKLPQILAHFGILKYNSQLEEQIQNEKFIRAKSRKEVEIRLSTVIAVEKIKQKLLEKGVKLNSAQIDNRIWNLSKKIKPKIKHHLTKTIYY